MAHGKTIQLYRGPAANWTSNNPVLAAGEPGYETDTNKMKIGDGTTAWNSLPYASGGGFDPTKYLGSYSSDLSVSKGDTISSPDGKVYIATQNAAPGTHGTLNSAQFVTSARYDTTSTSTSSGTINIAANVTQSGDVGVLICAYSQSAAPSAPSGWNLLGLSTDNVFYSGNYVAIYTKTVTAAEASSGFSVNTVSGSQYQTAVVRFYRNVYVPKASDSLLSLSSTTSSVHTYYGGGAVSPKRHFELTIWASYGTNSSYNPTISSVSDLAASKFQSSDWDGAVASTFSKNVILTWETVNPITSTQFNYASVSLSYSISKLFLKVAIYENASVSLNTSVWSEVPLFNDSSADIAPSPLTRVSLGPTTQASNSTTSSTSSDVDSGKLFVSFTAPPSGKVRVYLEATVSSNTNSGGAWSLRDDSGDIDGTVRVISYGISGYTRHNTSIVVGGLIPGNTYTWKWGYATATNAGNAFSIVYGGNSGTNVISTTNVGPAIMTVWAE